MGLVRFGKTCFETGDLERAVRRDMVRVYGKVVVQNEGARPTLPCKATNVIGFRARLVT